MANEKKLIYADDARRAILETEPKLAYCIERIKAVDAVEVVHGRWISKTHDSEPFEFTLYHCSECDTPCAMERNFCSYCGADMRERKEE